MKKKKIWLIEILIWFFILSISFYFFIYNTTVKESAKNSYYIFFDDAGGLVQGSPVRLMGINIGYVRDAKIFDNKVFVSFLVTKNESEMPKSAVATVEFYGLGGSTSLELTPQLASDDSNTAIIKPVESYRVQDFWDGQELVSNVMIDVYGSIGKTIEDGNLLNNKHLFKQSALVKSVSNQIRSVNTAQSVVIYKLTENILNSGTSLDVGVINE